MQRVGSADDIFHGVQISKVFQGKLVLWGSTRSSLDGHKEHDSDDQCGGEIEADT